MGTWRSIFGSSIKSLKVNGRLSQKLQPIWSFDFLFRVFRWSQKCSDIFIFSTKHDLRLKIFEDLGIDIRQKLIKFEGAWTLE